MFLKNLSLHNFRSFRKKIFNFSDRVTLIVGPNTSGKTNVLEAIYLLATGKSFRASKEVEMIRYGEEMSNVKCQMSHPEDGRPLVENVSLQIILTTGEVQGKRTARKLYRVNEVGKRWRDFAGTLKCVLFRPEDIDLILGSPSIRRNYLDSVLEQIDWQYRACSLAYKKGLRQRNKLLDKIREGEAKRAQLIFWNQLLIKNGQVITRKREKMIDFFNQILLGKSGRLGKLGGIEIFYDKSEISQERLEKYSQAELALGVTLVGPHRDDVAILKTKNQKPKTQIKNDNIKRNLALYGSRGEQRIAVFYLKLAELKFMLQKTNQRPVLLLDDILSELDKKNKGLVLTSLGAAGEIIDSCQVIVTSTEIEKEIKSRYFNRGPMTLGEARVSRLRRRSGKLDIKKLVMSPGAPTDVGGTGSRLKTSG